MEDIAPQTIWLGGCFTVGRVYFSSYPAPAGLQSRYFWTENWLTEDSSEKSTLFQISVFRSACLLAKSGRFFFIASVKRGFLAGLHDLSPNSRDSLRWIVLVLTTIPVSINLARIFWRTLWRASNHLMHKAVFSAAGNFWSAWPFYVCENAFILVFCNCIVHSCFANFQFPRDLTYRKV